MPKSEIIERKLDVKTLFLELCKKYILTSAEFEINISSMSRRKLTNYYESLNVRRRSIFSGDISENETWESLNEQAQHDVFDKVITQLIGLLRDTYMRFIVSKEYKLLIEKQLKTKTSTTEKV